MNAGAITLSTLSLFLANLWLAARSNDFYLAKSWQKLVAGGATLIICLLYIFTVFQQARLIYVLPIILITFSVLLIDSTTCRIPNRLTLYLAIFQTLSTIGKAVLEQTFMPLISIFIGVAVFTIFLIMNIATKGQLGMGDVKLSYSLAVGLGIISLSLSFWTFLLAFSMAGIFALGLLSTGKASLNSSVAFGPFMVLATWITLLLYIR